MNFINIVLGNFQEDFKELLPRSPGYLNCKIVAGHGNCEKGILSDNTEEDGMMLTRADEFKFEKVSKVISTFSSSKSKKPLLLCVNLMIPFGATFIYQLYEIEKGVDDIILKNQSTHREL